MKKTLAGVSAKKKKTMVLLSSIEDRKANGKWMGEEREKITSSVSHSSSVYISDTHTYFLHLSIQWKWHQSTGMWSIEWKKKRKIKYSRMASVLFPSIRKHTVHPATRHLFYSLWTPRFIRCAKDAHLFLAASLVHFCFEFNFIYYIEYFKKIMIKINSKKTFMDRVLHWKANETLRARVVWGIDAHTHTNTHLMTLIRLRILFFLRSRILWGIHF